MPLPLFPRAAYIHVPFCAHRCGYCNFTLMAGRGDLVPAYLAAIERELSGLGEPQPVDTLYFGGGTPTQLSLGQLEVLVRCVQKWHPLAAGGEWTIEANPADLSPAVIDAMAEWGVTRLSIGAQSFAREKLRLLERDHTRQQIIEAVQWAREWNLAVAVDLIFACPGETLASWRNDLCQLVELEPDHVSAYGLTFERGTTFWGRRLRHELDEVDEDLQRQMYELTTEKLTTCGFEHYEVSNFARPGCRSRHNETYWSGDGYFAAGPGAARYVNGRRQMNHRSTTTYIRRVLAGESPLADEETLSPERRAREMFVFGLRRLAGVSRREFHARTGFDVNQLFVGPLERFTSLGLLEDAGDRVRLTRDGLLVSDALWPEFL
jgi:oxygen-independent coproporphyrinogen-3 oxidase